MSEIKEITCYETSDGRIHRTLKSAENWEGVCKTFMKKKEEKSAPEISMRSWGEDDHIDKYFGRN